MPGGRAPIRGMGGMPCTPPPPGGVSPDVALGGVDIWDDPGLVVTASGVQLESRLRTRRNLSRDD